jgi:hypothetical protein
MTLILPATSLVADYYALISYLEEMSLPFYDPNKANAITWQWGGDVTFGYNPQGMVLIGTKGNESKRMGYREISVSYSLDLQLQATESTAIATNAVLLAWSEYLTVNILPPLSEKGLNGPVMVEGEQVDIQKSFLKAQFDRVAMNIRGDENACYGTLIIHGSFDKTFNTDIGIS